MKWLGVSLTYERKVGWGYRGVVGRRGYMYSATTIYTLSHITSSDSLMCTACKRGIIRLILKSLATTACISFDRSYRRRLLSPVIKDRY